MHQRMSYVNFVMRAQDDPCKMCVCGVWGGGILLHVLYARVLPRYNGIIMLESRSILDPWIVNNCTCLDSSFKTPFES